MSVNFFINPSFFKKIVPLGILYMYKSVQVLFFYPIWDKAKKLDYGAVKQGEECNNNVIFYIDSGHNQLNAK